MHKSCFGIVAAFAPHVGTGVSLDYLPCTARKRACLTDTRNWSRPSPRRFGMSIPDQNGVKCAETNASMSAQAPFGNDPVVLLTNDDGLDPGNAMVLDFAHSMVKLGYRVLVCAPGRNNSACGQKISLETPMRLRRHPDLENKFNCGKQNQLIVYSLDEGSPSDCVIIAIEPFNGLIARHGLRPLITLSGVNLGANLGPDILYSGTFAAARQAAMYGVPGAAMSLAEYGKRRKDPVYAQSCQRAVEAASKIACHLISVLPEWLPDAGRLRLENSSELVMASADCGDEAIRTAFAAGNVVVNVNIPGTWSGEYESCRLDSVLYRSVVNWQTKRLPSGVPDDDVCVVTIGGGSMYQLDSDQSDSAAVKQGRAAISTLATWPMTHPLALSQAFLDEALGTDGDRTYSLPSWMSK